MRNHVNEENDMKANFTITGDTSDTKLMTALNALLEQGYNYKVAPHTVKAIEAVPVIAASVPVIAAPVPAPTKRITASDPEFKPVQTIMPFPKKQFTPAKKKKRYRFDHPSGKTALQIALAQLRRINTTTIYDLKKYLVSEGFTEATAANIIYQLGVQGLAEMEGNYIGHKR